MAFLLLCSLLGIHMSVSNAVALPSYALHNVRHTNVTLAPPASFSGEEHSWQRNVYILQVTRIALLILLAISMHIIYARWQISQYHRGTCTEHPESKSNPLHQIIWHTNRLADKLVAMGTEMAVGLESMDVAIGVISDNEPDISAPTIQADVAVEPAPAISVQHGDLRAPSRAHQSFSSSEGASDHAETPNALYDSNGATETTATNKVRTTILVPRKLSLTEASKTICMLFA